MMVARSRLVNAGQMRGDSAKAEEYSKLAKEFAARWVKEEETAGHLVLFVRRNERLLGYVFDPAAGADDEGGESFSVKCNFGIC